MIWQQTVEVQERDVGGFNISIEKGPKKDTCSRDVAGIGPARHSWYPSISLQVPTYAALRSRVSNVYNDAPIPKATHRPSPRLQAWSKLLCACDDHYLPTVPRHTQLTTIQTKHRHPLGTHIDPPSHLNPPCFFFFFAAPGRPPCGPGTT